MGLTLVGIITENIMDTKVKAIFMDFDGVISTGDVWTDQNGTESVRCSRRDSLGLRLLKDSFPSCGCSTV